MKKRFSVKQFIALILAVFGVTGCDTPGNVPDTPSETSASGDDTVQSDGFGTVGYFAFSPQTSKELDFLVESGFNLVEFCDVSWYYKPGSKSMEEYQNGLKNAIDAAHKKGLKVYVVLLSTLEQWNGDAECGNGQGLAFDPADRDKMNERLGYIRQSVEQFKEADGFSLFGGDPGGVLGISAEGGIEYFFQMGRDVREIVREIAPNAEFNLNLWAAAQFEQKYVDPLRVDFWLGEGIVGREVIAEDNLLGKDIGIEIPGHDYYRTLALSLYSATGRRPEEKFPSASDISNILGKGVERCWAFSHLLMPDVDEEVSFNTQRVLYYVNKMREIGMNGVVMGNVRYGNYADLYAYGRFANDSEATVDEVLREYAGFLATEETADDLAEIFKFLNNYDSNLPVCADDLKLPDLETRIKSVDEAIEMLRNVKLSDDRHFMLVEPAISYYLKIMARLMEIKADTRPEDAEDRAISLVTFDQNNGGTISVESPALNGKAGKLTIRVGEYNLAQGTIDAVDALDFARYGYVHYDVYVDEDVTTRSYVLLCSDTENVGLDRFWQYDFGGSINLKAGWNHISVKISKGIYCGKNEIDWGKITDYRILFWNDTEEPLTVYLDNFYISNYAENRHP